MIFLSGHIPRNPDGSPVNGRIGENISTSPAYELARQVTLSLLSTIQSEIGDLDNVKRIVKMVCIMNASPDYTEHPTVANGASDLLVGVFPVEVEYVLVLKGDCDMADTYALAV